MMSKPSTAFIKQVLTGFDISLVKNIKFAHQQGHLTNDSRMISQGDIFCAIVGHAQDGRHYIDTAIENGASLIISESELQTEHGNVSVIGSADKQVTVVSFYQLNNKLFELASAYYQAPQTRMTMIGITGTNGKTSTSQLLGQVLTQCQSCCAIIGTNGAGIIDNQSENHSSSTLTELANTTPSATDLVQFFNDFADQGASHLAMEVSSHALEQGRVSADIFDIAVFTNLSRDHLDYHGTMADYARSKRQLFTNSDKQIAVLNGDDKQAKAWLSDWSTAKNLWLYGRSESVKEHTQFVSCHCIKHHSGGVDFVLNTHLGDIDIQSPLLGDFNIDNLLAVISVLLIENIALTVIAEQIKQLNAIAGRMESFSASTAQKKTPTAVVDYAHTPDALEKALIACRQHCHGNLYVVFGCGGDRDKGKRPLMAQAAEKHADCLVVTSDNPRTEAPMGIINDVVAGLSDKAELTVIENRKQAVLATLVKAQANDVVLLAGKGHEDYIILGKEKIDYNERQVVMDFFNHLNTNQTTSPTGEQA